MLKPLAAYLHARWFGYKTSGELSRITLRPNTHIGLTMFIAYLFVAEALDSLQTTCAGALFIYSGIQHS